MTIPGRFMLVTINKRTGTHQVHNWPTASHADIIRLVPSIVIDGSHQTLQVFKMHADLGSDTPPPAKKAGLTSVPKGTK